MLYGDRVLRADDFIGRDREREVAATFVAAAASGPAVLRIDGEAGIGKTTLFRYTIELARLGGSTVLHCSPTHAESEMSYVGLTDMLRDLPESAFDALPAPQRHSLEVATLRTASSEVPLDERSVGTGLSTLLVHLCDANPVILAVDDLQWLDRSSVDVLTFAARRLTSGAIGILTCERTDASAPNLCDVVPSLLWRDSISLAGLSAAALFHVVRNQLGMTLPRPALVQVTETSRGNPFAALALSRAVGRGDELPRGAQISELVHGLTAARISEFTEPARHTLLAAALSPRAMVPMFVSMGLGAALDEVESNAMVRIVDGRVAFVHPLLAAAVQHVASGRQQRNWTRQRLRPKLVAPRSPPPSWRGSRSIAPSTVTAPSHGHVVCASPNCYTPPVHPSRPPQSSNPTRVLQVRCGRGCC